MQYNIIRRLPSPPHPPLGFRALQSLERRGITSPVSSITATAITTKTTPGLVVADQAAVREEQHLDGDGQAQVQGDDEDQHHLARLLVGGAQDRVQVAQEEGGRQAEADAHKDPVEDADLAPADERHGDPDQVGVAVQRPALEQVGRLGPEVAQREVQRHGDEERIAVDEAGGTCVRARVRACVSGGIIFFISLTHMYRCKT